MSKPFRSHTINLSTIMNGINNIAVEGQQCDIHVKPVFNKDGSVKEVQWTISNANFVDEDMSIPDFIQGIYMDGDQYPVSIYHMCQGHPRLIGKRETTAMKNTGNKRTGKSAFALILETLEMYYEYIDDDVLDALCDVTLTKERTHISLPILQEIDKSITDQQLVQYYKSFASAQNKNRYWKKVIVLNGRRFFITNHVFHTSVPLFIDLMVELTGIMFEDAPENEAIDGNDTNQVNAIEQVSSASLATSSSTQDTMSMQEATNAIVTTDASDIADTTNHTSDTTNHTANTTTAKSTNNYQGIVNSSNISVQQSKMTSISADNSSIDDILKASFGFGF